MSEELKIYEVTNRATGEKSYQVAPDAEAACKQAGWPSDDCWTQPTREKKDKSTEKGYQVLVRIPCEICPYQYAECRKPDEAECPVRSQLPELADWLRQAAKSHLCEHVGEEIAKKDYQLKQKWVPIEEAVKELSPKG